MSGRPLVMVGTPNHMNRTTAAPRISIQRMLGILNQAQSPNRPRNGHTSGRPKAASTPNTSAQR